jgi:hypothetical protein
MWDFYGSVHSDYLFAKKLITIYSIAYTELDADFLCRSYSDRMHQWAAEIITNYHKLLSMENNYRNLHFLLTINQCIFILLLLLS